MNPGEDEQHTLLPINTADMQVSQSTSERAAFETALLHAGRSANADLVNDVFAEYHATCRPNTLNRLYYDLRCLSTFLREEQQVHLTPQALAANPESWRGMTYGLVTAFRTWMLRQGFSIGTINNRIATVHQYCRLAGPPPRGVGVLSEQDFTAILTVSGYAGKTARNVDQHRTRNRIPTRIGRKKADYTPLTTQDVARLQRSTPPPPPSQRIPRKHDLLLPARDALMWSLLDEHLLRVSELVALEIEDIDLDELTITVYREKGDETWVYEMGPQTEAHLRVYLKQLQEQGRESGPLFFGYAGKQMTTSAINKRVGIIGKQLGFGSANDTPQKEKHKGRPKQRLSPHDLRHHAAIELLNEGTPLNELQALGGWRTAHMPLHYAKLSKNAIIRSPRRDKHPKGDEDP